MVVEWHTAFGECERGIVDAVGRRGCAVRVTMGGVDDGFGLGCVIGNIVF